MGCAGSTENDPKTLATKLAALDRTILYKYLSGEQLTAFASHCTLETYGENRLLFGQNDGTEDALYIVAEGAVNLDVAHNKNPAYKERPEDMDDGEFKVEPVRLLVANRSQLTPQTVKTTLTTRRVGEFFGARVLHRETNGYSATTVGRTVCLKLTPLKWDQFLTKHGQLKERILKCLSIGMEEALGKLEFLKQIQPAKLQLLAACFRFITVDKDEVLFRRDDLGKEGNPLHYLLEGEVKVQQLEDGEEKVVAIVKKLQFFGEVGLVIHLPRTSTVTARKRCLFLELSQADFRQFCLVAPEVLEAFRDKLEEYQIPLKYLIHNPVMQEYLMKYMLEEKSSENLQFWIAVKDFRLSDNKDPDAIRAEATEIVEKHIKEGSDFGVNIQGTTRKEVLTAMKGQINRDLLVKPEDEILVLMTRDTWGRFKGKKLFHECLSKLTSTPNYKPKDLKANDAPKKPVAVDPGF